MKVFDQTSCERWCVDTRLWLEECLRGLKRGVQTRTQNILCPFEIFGIGSCLLKISAGARVAC